MKKLSEIFKKLWEKFKSFGKGIRIAIIVAVVAVLVAIISALVFANSEKYETLFYNLDSADAQIVMAALEEKAVVYKVEGNNIMVDPKLVDELRLELSSGLSSSSKGYELMDSSTSFGMTDEEFKIYKVRMIQGELEKSIETLSGIEDSKVMITLATDSVFVQSAKEGSASIVLKTKAGVKLSQENIKAIVSMVSMGTDNIPQSNISVVDTNGNLLTKDLGEEGSGEVSSETINSQLEQERKFEDDITTKIRELLEPVVGAGNVQAQVNVDLDFDSKKISEIEIDPNNILISQETENSYNETNGGGTTSESPVDNNMSNTIEEEDGDTSTSKTEHQINNYDHSNKTTETIKAPGEVRRMTVSVFVNGKLDENTQVAFEEAIKSATGYDETRKDTVSLVGMNFDTTLEEEAKSQVDAYNEALAVEKKKNMIIASAIGLGILIAAIILIILLRKKHEDKESEALLDVVIGDEPIREQIKYDPIDFGDDSEKSHLENEIKKYAQDKPDQVVDIIKSWLSENER